MNYAAIQGRHGDNPPPSQVLLRITQTGNPVKPAVDGELAPFDDADRSAAAQATIAELKEADESAGSMRAHGL
ncbi:hypothetical protein ACWYXK_06860 [Janthinobacterium lividum]